MTTEENRHDEESEKEADAVIGAPQLQRSRSPGVARARRFGRFIILNHPVVSAEEAFQLLCIDRTTGYKAIRDGTFPLPVVRIGRVIRIPTAALVQLLDPDLGSDPAGDSQEGLI
jgi:predicted DNA-binding transcriptional regulator AlpA